ncbi:hypothetical protein VHUM_00437 [Vanrija humicola]|uniref:Uncharacterized protein n=1 Tax=Vanrija humicola TaxID=5417 RepID=A0A7D8V2F6_VANHU|nr:hypothetical protein VHUM_00437 [Vanrija humicola]
MFKKIASAVSSISGTPRNGTPEPPVLAGHHGPGRVKTYAELAKTLSDYGVPVATDDCAACDSPCADGAANGAGGAGTVAEIGNAWDGKTYEQYVHDKYGDFDEFPSAIDTDWDSDLPGSGGPPVGRVVVISTGKSDWPRDHVDAEDSLSYQVNKVLSKQKGAKNKKEGNAADPSTYVLDSAFPPPSSELSGPIAPLPSLYSSSLISQADDPEDQTAIVFPDWKAVLEVENSLEGAQGLWDGALSGSLGRAGQRLQNEGEGCNRRRSYVLPYRAIVLLCSHKRRDKRCSIAAPLLRSALVTCLTKHGVHVDETGSSLAVPELGALEELEGTDAEREAEVGRRIANIEGVHGGEGGEVGIFNINHLGGHRYAGVMLILFPSGAYLSYGRVTPQEIPRVVEDTILKGKIVPGLLRSAAGVVRKGATDKENGFLEW